MATRTAQSRDRRIHRQRLTLLAQIVHLFDKPMVVLAIVWTAIVLAQLSGHGSPLLTAAGHTIWIVFIVDFALEFVVAPSKRQYLRRHWLTAVALFVPALRMLRIVGSVRALAALSEARNLQLLQVVGTANRSLRVARRTLGRRGVGYALLANVLIVALGAAGIYAFEQPPVGDIHSYTEALWWTAMLMTTIGAGYSPVTPQGRFLTLLLSLAALALLGYVTAALASYFVAQDKVSDERAGRSQVKSLDDEVAALRADIAALRALMERDGGTGAPGTSAGRRDGSA